MNRLAALVLCLVAHAATSNGAGRSPEAAATIVVYNRSDPASRALAEYYAGKRDIPPGQVLGLYCSPAEEISRVEYELTIATPLRAAFTRFGWWKIERGNDGRRSVVAADKRIVALIRGMPLKIQPDPNQLLPKSTANVPSSSAFAALLPVNEASVDSELAAFFALDHPTAALLGNPYYRRLASILQVAPADSPLLVCRLDGPSDAIVRRMIDDALAAEATGLWGWAYLDARNIHSGTYATGDEWITAAGRSMRRQGIPVIADYAPETLPTGYPITNAAVYYGWYSTAVDGPFADGNPGFVPGAIAVHLFSFSANTLRTGQSWAPALLADGAAVTMGNVYEPFLEFTVNFDILQDRLMNGLTLAESAYAAYRGLSWMGIVLGDPLYRPYARWRDPADGPAGIWKRYRQTVLGADGDPLLATDALRTLADSQKNSVPLEALAQAQAANAKFEDALRTLDAAFALEKNPDVRFRLVLEQIEILRRSGQTEAARRKLSAALGACKSDAQQRTLGAIVLATQPSPAARATPP